MTDPKDMTRLVERLRSAHNIENARILPPGERVPEVVVPKADADSAADAITTLLEEVGRYREALDAVDRTAFIGITQDCEETKFVALESIHDIAAAALQGSVDRLNDERMPLPPPPVEEN